jgi:rhamnosyltransferase
MRHLDSDRNDLWDKELSAVVVTHNPNEMLLELLEELTEQVAHIIIVDNASGGDSLKFLEKAKQSLNVTIIKNAENMGVAVALNQGMDKAGSLGAEWVISFDQDSRPETDMVGKLWALSQRHEESAKIAIVAPRIIDKELGRSSAFLRKKSLLLYERLECHDAPLEDVTFVITAGSLIRLSVFEELGGFREDFFIDYVDTEFCLRLVLSGYKILVDCDARLRHSFGNRRKSQWGPFVFYPSFHPPERWYTISRNRIQMIRSFGFRLPHWLIYELMATAFILIRMLLTEDMRPAKLSALMRGTWDGIMGKMGKPFWAIENAEKSDSPPRN